MASSGTSGSTTLLIVGTVSALIGLLALGIGGGLLVFSTLRGDRDGLLSIDDVNLATDTYALVSENLELTAWPGPADWTPRLGDVRLRLEVTEGADEALFVGVAPTAAVADYLDGVAHEVLTSINHSGASSRTQPGTATPAPPGQAQFWSESVSGPGTQTLTWDVAPGNWTTVVMAADGSAGVDVSASAALRVPVVTPLGFGLLAVAAVALVIAVILLVAGAATRAHQPPSPRLRQPRADPTPLP